MSEPTYRVSCWDHDLQRFNCALAGQQVGRQTRRVRLWALRPIIRALRRHWDDDSFLVERN